MNVPDSAMDVMMWPLIWTMVGMVVWYLGLRVEFNTEKGVVKWLSLIPLGIGTFLGGTELSKMMDYGYRQLLDRNLTRYAHVVALLAPLGAIGFVLAWNWYQKRRSVQDVY